MAVLVLAFLWERMDAGLLRAREFLRAGLLGLVAMSGLEAVLIYHYVSVGVWDAFFRTQEKYGHGIHNPLETLPRILGSSKPQETQSIVVMVFVLCCLAFSFVKRRKWQRLDMMVVLFTAGFWSFPVLMGQGVSSYRAESLLLPSVVLARHMLGVLRSMFLVVFCLHLFADGAAVLQ